MSGIVEQIRADLKANANEKVKQGFERFFKEPIKVYGLKTPVVRKIALKYWPCVRVLGKAELFGVCEELLGSDFCEEAFVVSVWLPNCVDCFVPGDLVVFRRWVELYVDNWAKCDSFCNHTVGGLIEKFPELVGELVGWAKSENRWLRRGAAVSLIVPAKRGLFLREAFEVCDVLLLDGDDLVQKGYGWLLKEESRLHQREVFDYVVLHRRVMPRTALRYAVELMPKELKAQAMMKN